MTDVTDLPGITLTREQLEAWAGRELADEEVAELDQCIPNSSIPEAIGTIVDNIENVCCDTAGCRESLSDNEGYDGKCGTCADRLEKGTL